MRHASPAAGPLFVLLLLLAAAGAAAADRLHLESGGYVDAESWWIEDDFVMYESAGGTVGIPRAMVVRIEKADGSAKATGFNAPVAPTPTKRKGAVERNETLARGQEAFRAGDYETASFIFYDALADDPELHAARAYYAAAEMALGHDGSALAAIHDGLARSPRRPEFHELLGDLRNRDERVDEALNSWRKAFELKPGDRLRQKIVKAERELQASEDYDFARSSHFNLLYDGQVAKDLAASVLDHLEEEYWRLSDLFDHAPSQAITVQLYPDREFREVTLMPEWVGGIYDGKIRVPLGGLRRLNPAAQRVLTHELTHAVVHAKTRGRAPRWLQEGLAQRAEGKQLSSSDAEWIGEQLRGKDAADWESGGFSYTMSLSLTDYLADRRGHHNMIYMLTLLGEGNDPDEAMRRVYGDDYAGMCRAWKRRVAP